MPFPVTPLPELRAQALSELELRFPERTILRRSPEAEIADAMAGLIHSQFGWLDWAHRQIFVDSAEGSYLDRFGRVWGVARKPAAAATGTLTLTGSAGAVLPAGRTLRRADGQAVQTLADATLVASAGGGAASVAVRAVQPGAAGDAEVGETYRLQEAVVGIDGAAIVADAGDGTGLSGGADAEGDAPFRARILKRIQAPPHGGAGQDYLAWALAVAGVTRAWVKPGWQGVGTVGVAVAADDDPAGPAAPQSILDAVAAAIDPLRPVTADVIVFAPTPLPVDIEIGALSPDTAAVRAAVETELADLFRREGDLGVVFRRSKIWEAVSIAAGEASHAINAPAADIAPAAHELPVLGEVTYV